MSAPTWLDDDDDDLEVLEPIRAPRPRAEELSWGHRILVVLGVAAILAGVLAAGGVLPVLQLVQWLEAAW